MSIDYAKARETMVEQQVRPWDVLDPRVLETIGSVPREAFVPEAVRALAYADTALPLGHGESMMKPVLEGRALQAANSSNGTLKAADALAWDNDQHFDAICVSGAVHALPPRFVEWLKPGGRMFVVQGRVVKRT